MTEPTAGVLALMAIGTPANARRSSRVTAPASSIARSPCTCTNAPRRGSAASMRRSAASTASGGDTSPSRRSAPVSTADRKAKSCTGPRTVPAAPMRDNAVMSAHAEVQSGLEGVVAFATEIAEPDKEGGALRYRGYDIEDLVGPVRLGRVWGLLVDVWCDPGLPPAEPHPLHFRSGDPRV